VSRVPAGEIEAIVIKILRDRLASSGHGPPVFSEHDAVAAHITKIEIRATQLAMTVKATAPPLHHMRETDQDQDDGAVQDRDEVILVPWIKPPARKFREVIQPRSAPSHRPRPIRAERRAGLIRAIARGRQWLDDIVAGRMTIESIAIRQKCSVRQINLTLSMAFLAPPLVKAAIEGRLPRGIGIAELRDAPAEWSKQYLKLGLPPL
jgi:hypothetical protein